MQPLFITGIGTGIGKTLVSAIVAEALGAAYWKPIQAGYAEGTDTGWVGERISRPEGRLLPEVYQLELPVSPHIAARRQNVTISLDRIVDQFHTIGIGEDSDSRLLVIEGAGGLLVPLNETQFVLDLIQRLDATVILVSRNYLGSINHSLMTAAICRSHRLRVAGWIFNDQYLSYEEEIVGWSGIPAIASIPFRDNPDREFVAAQAERIRPALLSILPPKLPYL
jgi:dethiobiotin synthetase